MPALLFGLGMVVAGVVLGSPWWWGPGLVVAGVTLVSDSAVAYVSMRRAGAHRAAVADALLATWFLSPPARWILRRMRPR
jgi:hypothetical protein